MTALRGAIALTLLDFDTTVVTHQKVADGLWVLFGIGGNVAVSGP